MRLGRRAEQRAREHAADAPHDERLLQAAIATSIGDRVLPDPEELWLARFDDPTLLVLAVVAHAHGTSARQVRRATGQWPGALRLSLHRLRRAGLVVRERRPGPHHWFATAEGTRLGVTPYVTRLLSEAVALSPGSWWRRSRIGTEHGPPIFRPSTVLAEVNDPDHLGEVIRTGTREDRAYALAKLIALNDPASVRVLCEVAQARGDDEPLARQAAVALGHFATPASIATLTDLAAHRDSIIREAAARSLGHLRATTAVPTLVTLLSYPSAPVRAATIRALRRIGDPSAAPAIAGALTDSDGAVRRGARRALVELGADAQLEGDPRRPWPLRMLNASLARRAKAHAPV